MEELNTLLDKLGQLNDGELQLTSASGVWQFYMLDGQLLYASGKTLAARRFTRAAHCHRPRWQWTVNSAWITDGRPWEIPLIEQAMTAPAKGIAQNSLSPIQAKLILRMVLEECLFELLYDGNAQSEWNPYHLEVSSDYRAAALSRSEVQRILEKAQRLVSTWKASSLGYIRLSDAPLMTEHYLPTQNTQQNNLQSTHLRPIADRYLKGNHDLWDILVAQAHSLNGLTQLLQPLVEKGAIKFQTIPDIKLPVAAQHSPQLFSAESTTNQAQFAPQTQSTPQTQSIPQTQPTPQKEPVTTATIGATTDTGFTNKTAKSVTPAAKVATANNAPLIACIDDSPVLTLSLKKMLTSAGYRTLSIPEPMRGFSKLIEHRPDLILLDLMLPNADGYSICKFLRETPIFENTPIIILTGQDSNLDRMRARLVGATEFLTKPPQTDTLIAMVSRHL
ncbi:MAG: response regulator [Cyanobacteria bacterium J06643_4]